MSLSTVRPSPTRPGGWCLGTRHPYVQAVTKNPIVHLVILQTWISCTRLSVVTARRQHPGKGNSCWLTSCWSLAPCLLTWSRSFRVKYSTSLDISLDVLDFDGPFIDRQALRFHEWPSLCRTFRVCFTSLGGFTDTLDFVWLDVSMDVLQVVVGSLPWVRVGPT